MTTVAAGPREPRPDQPGGLSGQHAAPRFDSAVCLGGVALRLRLRLSHTAVEQVGHAPPGPLSLAGKRTFMTFECVLPSFVFSPSGKPPFTWHTIYKRL